jgi:branched-chain amino acid transport system permease protein
MSLFLEQLVNGIVLGSVYATFAFGFGLVIANLGVFNVAHKAVFAAGAIVAYLSAQVFAGLPLPVLILVSAAAAALCNVLVYLLLVRPLDRRRNREMAAFLSCLGGLFVLTEVAELVLGNREARFPAEIPTGGPTVLGLTVSYSQLLMLGTSVAAFLLVHGVIEWTHLGRAIRATSYDPETSALLGINPRAVSAVVFALSGALAGVAAAVIGATYNVVDAAMGLPYFVIGLTVMVLGGFGNTVGTLVAGLLLGCVSTLSTGFLPTGYRDVFLFGTLVLVLAFRSEGLFPTRSTHVKA